jgi:hypothetical protein
MRMLRLFGNRRVGRIAMPRISVTIRGANKLMRDIDRWHFQNEKALQIAIRKEAFNLRSQLKKEIKAGAPGGMHFEGLSYMARRRRYRKSWLPNKPLSRLAAPIRYDVVSNNPFAIAVGWTNKTPMSVRKIVTRQQRGFTSRVSERRESYFRHRGGELSERSKNRRYFFLRKSTQSFRTDPRPIMEPFWARHKMGAMRNIRLNFRRKMRGERI